jgi:hypothetical protein
MLNEADQIDKTISSALVEQGIEFVIDMAQFGFSEGSQWWSKQSEINAAIVEQYKRLTELLVKTDFSTISSIINDLGAFPVMNALIDEITRWQNNLDTVLTNLYKDAFYTLELGNSPRVTAEVDSPVEIRVYDTQGRVTGIVNGHERNEIPHSIYQNNTITIFFPTDSYMFEISGTSEGSYDITLMRVAGQKVNKFTKTEVPVSASTTHLLAIDWDALAEDGHEVPVQIDSDGDGTFEDTTYILPERLPERAEEEQMVWAYIVVGVLLTLAAVLILWRHVAKGNRARA